MLKGSIRSGLERFALFSGFRVLRDCGIYRSEVSAASSFRFALRALGFRV